MQTVQLFKKTKKQILYVIDGRAFMLFKEHSFGGFSIYFGLLTYLVRQGGSQFPTIVFNGKHIGFPISHSDY